MRRLYVYAFLLCIPCYSYSQEIVWQKDIKSSTQDFLSQITTTIDQQYLITGSSIRSTTAANSAPAIVDGAVGPNNGYDFHLVKFNQQGEEVWEKYFSGQNHDFLSATVSTQEGGFLAAGTSFSPQGS